MRLQNFQFRPTLELLEKRELPASNLQANLSNSYLYVEDTTPKDVINISQANGQISVSGISIYSNGSKVPSVSASAVAEVVVYSYGGGCNIDLDLSSGSAVSTAAYVAAYGGNNTVIGGSGNETLYAYGGGSGLYAGSGGNDYLIGYGGGNTLVGGTVYSVLYGYGGDNKLYGKSGTSVLISGSVSASDQLNGGTGYNWYYRPTTAGQPFADGEQVSDVVQGRGPLCQTDAALAVAAQQGFNFAKNIKYLGNDYYQVQLYGVSAQTVYFNGYYNDTDTQVDGGSPDFWQVLMQRARLQALGISPNAVYTSAQWDQINNNLGGRLYSVNDALTMFTGRTTTTISPSQATPQQLQAALANGQLVVASSVYADEVTSDGIIGNHAYAVLSVYYANGQWLVRLYNPWGTDSVNGRTIDYLSGQAAANDGFITLSWGQFTNSANFHGYTLA